MSYPKMKYSGLRDEDRCIVRSEEEEAALMGLWADTPAAFYDKLPPGCTKLPKPAAKSAEARKEAPKPSAVVVSIPVCELCGEQGHGIRACPEAARLQE